MKSIAEIKAAISCPVPSISTPFLENGDIDWAGVDRIVDFEIENGAKSLLITNGDSLLTILTDREVGELTERVVKTANGRAAVLAGTKQWCSRQLLEFAGFAKEAGADVVLPIFPDWANSTGADHCADLFRDAGKVMPVMALTNFSNGRGIPVSVFQTLIDEKTPGFVGVKDDMCGAYGRRLAALLGGNYAFMSGGRAENHLDVAPYGPDGYLSIFMRFKPQLAWGYWNRFVAGDIAGAVRWIMQYEVKFMDFLSTGMNFDMIIHYFMAKAGLCQKWRRAPYASASDAQAEQLDKLWDDLSKPFEE